MARSSLSGHKPISSLHILKNSPFTQRLCRGSFLWKSKETNSHWVEITTPPPIPHSFLFRKLPHTNTKTSNFVDKHSNHPFMSSPQYSIPNLPLPFDLETKENVSRQTATRYLNEVTKTGLIQKIRVGRNHYYINIPLMQLFLSVSDTPKEETTLSVESVSEQS